MHEQKDRLAAVSAKSDQVVWIRLRLICRVKSPERAGAARECAAALLVNPYDHEGVAIAINRALAMPLEERRQRHAAIFKVLLANDLTQWADRFLAALEGPPVSEV